MVRSISNTGAQMQISPNFYLYPPAELREFIRLSREAQVIRYAVDEVLNQFLMSVFLHATGYDAVFDDERIRLTVDMNFVLHHPPWRVDWTTLNSSQEPLATDPTLKEAIIEQGIRTYYALRQSHSLNEYLRNLPYSPSSHVHLERVNTGHLVIKPEAILRH